jgi:hypothetical protein
MEPEKKRVSGRVQVEPTRPEPDPKTRIFSGFRVEKARSGVGPWWPPRLSQDEKSN